MLKPLPKLQDRPDYIARAATLKELADINATTQTRLDEIERLLAAQPVVENPLDVLKEGRPADLNGLQLEHAELRGKRKRIASASKLVMADMQRLSEESANAPEIVGPVLEIHADLAAEYCKALQVIVDIQRREDANLDRLRAGGYGSAGLQLTVAGHVDWPGVLREGEHAVSAINRRLVGTTEQARKAA